MMAEEKKRTELKISGMTCATCATTIEESILSRDGVYDARGNLVTETATVEEDSTKSKLTDIEKAVTDTEYGVIGAGVTLKIGGVTCTMCDKTIEAGADAFDALKIPPAENRISNHGGLI